MVRAEVGKNHGVVDRSGNVEDVVARQWDRVQSASERVVGSDAWLDLMMNFEKERGAIERYSAEMQRYYLDREANLPQDLKVDLLEQHVALQAAFCGSEYGCGRYLQVQPSYYSLVGNDPEKGLWVTPAGLRQFGDQSKSYIQENERVGDGLAYVYGQLQRAPEGTWVAIVSPTEEYQEYKSTTDVINFMRVVGRDREGNAVVEGKYFVVGEVLSQKQRRFLHNLFYAFGEAEVDYRTEVPTDILKTRNAAGSQGFDDAFQQELYYLVARPNLFTREEGGEEAIFKLIQEVSNRFEQRFGERLLEQDDLKMYPVIQQVVDDEIDALMEHLVWAPNKHPYYRTLRNMIYMTQQKWAGMHTQSGVDVSAYLQQLMMGELIVGFEGGGMMDGSGDIWRYGSAWGTESTNKKYCSVHEIHYSGDDCPRCKGLSFSAH